MVTKVRLPAKKRWEADQIVTMDQHGRVNVAYRLLETDLLNGEETKDSDELAERYGRVLGALLESLDQDTFERFINQLGGSVIRDCHSEG